MDENKHAAVAAMIAFLSDNGWRFDATADEAESAFLTLAAGEMSKSTFTALARQQMHEKPRMELHEFFARLKYQTVAECLHAGLIHDDPAQAHKERVDTIVEASQAIPAIREANFGAVACEKDGNQEAATILHAQSNLLTAIYRIAEDMGYEW